MKNIWFGSAVTLVALCFSCSKSNDSSHESPTVTKLKAHTWVYYESFYNYNLTSTTMVYRQDKPLNQVNLSQYSLDFTSDSTYDIVDPVTGSYHGKWSLSDNEQYITTTDDGGTHTSRIMKITDSCYEWYDSTVTGGYGRLIPQNFHFSSPSTARNTLIAAHPWEFDEFFYNYNTANPALVYKKGKPLNLVDWSSYTLSLKGDGTYTITDVVNGSYNGVWTLTGDSTLTTTDAGGTHSSNVSMLTNSLYNWYNPASTGGFGELIAK